MNKAARDHGERRGFRRWPSGEDAFLKLKDEVHPCKVVDVSASGTKIAADIQIAVGDEITLLLRGLLPLRGRVVRVDPGTFAAVFVEGPQNIFR